MTETTARLSTVQGNILVTLDGPDGTSADSMEICALLSKALLNGVIPYPVQKLTGWQDTALLNLADAREGELTQADIEGAAAAVKAVLDTAGIETHLDDTFDRSRRYEEHWMRFMEAAEEEVRAALTDAA
ncbi:hypothetical protein [Arthrobacter sp. zg-Y1110]|uniref:hypothetical protein n=1 Tax=Arthrobacter sp. zg-Y1110 TaxID=2886932 RepID=UPI001D133246|nr:hypothetical protein [Arthrobacter sp. zg-Y1110]MCC3292807.1 hypothetical protein [Arthrobacter sp. zg-Y1110]UWX86747.1 hypothetical protein N2K99_18055 [Arthrobacter sp. zg-Y1110]